MLVARNVQLPYMSLGCLNMSVRAATPAARPHSMPHRLGDDR